MAFGGMLGLMGVPLPGTEYGIALSAILLGAAALFEIRPPLGVAAALVGFFAIFHGHAHGTELPPGQSALLYSMGFVIATGCLHALGIGIGTVHRWGWGQKLAPLRRGIGSCGWCVLSVEGDPVKGTTQSRLPLYAFVVLTFVMYALPAEAHLNSTGMGPFYDGLMHFLLMHFLMSPEDIVPVLALALLAGLRGASYGRRALFTLPVAWLLGGLAGLSAMTAKPHPFVAAAWFLLLGGLLAADAKVSLPVTTALAALLGIYHGYLNGSGMGPFDTAAVALLGLVLAVFVLIALVSVFRTSATCALGPNCRPCRRKLDRSQRSLAARLGRSNTLGSPSGSAIAFAS